MSNDRLDRSREVCARIRWVWCLAAALSAAAAGCGGDDGRFTPEETDTDTGVVRGGVEEEAVHFLGIPYAAPPVGDLRWKPPQAVVPWEGVLQADAYPPACTQPSDSNVGDDAVALGGEDCLYLNVWSPADRTEEDCLPVLFFLHGGGNFLGSTAEPLASILDLDDERPLYHGARLAARQRVVVVTINYRLGALGFFTHPGLEAESPDGSSGNYGLLDQIAALSWVQRNIASFGGDPDRVLLFGQSGGARDVCLLMNSPQAEGFFSRAAFHSGPCSAQDEESAAAHREALAAETGCNQEADPIACLRAVPAEELVLAEAARPDGLASGAFRPTVDGYVVPGQPRERFDQGLHHHLPFVLGTNALEYAHRWTEMNETQYRAATIQMFGQALGQQVLDAYPVEDYDSAAEAFATMMSDKNVTCPTRRLARAVSASQDEPVFLYRFHQVLSADERLGDGAYHTTELLYLFQHMDGEAFAATDDDRAVEQAMACTWAGFAAGGTPHCEGLAPWPAFASPEERHLDIQPDPAPGQDLKRDLCDFWDSLLP